MANEVSEAIRILEVGGRGIVLSAKVAEKGFLALMKLINTLYLSKWRGKTNLMRLRATKGESLAFFQIGSENRTNLRQIEQLMKKHGIMFAKLPDLCGGDSRTQYAFSPADAEKMQLFVKNYQDGFVNSNGKKNKTKVEVITGQDYEKTGYKKTGEKTKEYDELEKDAVKQERKAEARSRKKQTTTDKANSFSSEVEKADFARDCNLDARRQKFSKVVEFNFKEELGAIKEEGKNSFVAEKWDYKSSKDLVAISIPQSSLCVTLPNGALGSIKKGGMRDVVLDATAEYWVVNKQTLERSKMSGKDIGAMFKKPYLKERIAATKNLFKNRPAIKARNIIRKK